MSLPTISKMEKITRANHAEMQGVGGVVSHTGWGVPTQEGGAVCGGWLDRSFFVFLKLFIEDHFPTHHF